MADDRRRVPPRGRLSKQSAQNPREERPFDLWLNRQLHAMYDDIAHEPLPLDVVELIEMDGRKPGADGPPEESADQQPSTTQSGNEKD